MLARDEHAANGTVLACDLIPIIHPLSCTENLRKASVIGVLAVKRTIIDSKFRRMLFRMCNKGPPALPPAKILKAAIIDRARVTDIPPIERKRCQP